MVEILEKMHVEEVERKIYEPSLEKTQQVVQVVVGLGFLFQWLPRKDVQLLRLLQ